MNLETISSPGGETGAACSLSSLLALGCRSKAEAAHSFAKKLHTKLWSLSPSVTDGLSTNQTGDCHEEKEENASTWGVAVEARFDVNSKRVETVVTSVPLITTQNHNKVLPTVVYQPSAGLSRQGSLDQSTGEQIIYSVGIMEHKNTNHHCNSLENNGWTNYRKHDGQQSSSLVRGQDQESDTSSTTTTNPMSDSDQYFDFGIETPLDLDSAGEETVSHDNNTIVINHDDGLPVQPEGMESGCIFGSPSTLSSGEDSDELEDREEEPSFYESLSQSPASVGFKANHDRFNFGGQSHLGHVYEPVLDRPSVVNTNNESDILGHNSSCCVGDTLTAADSNDQPDKTAPAQSAEQTPRVDLERGPLSQGDLEDESNLRDSDESTSGPLRSQITQFASPVLPSLSSCDSAANENLTDNYSNNQEEEDDEVLDVLEHFSHLKLDMVRLDPVIVDKLFSGSAPVNDTHQSSIRASSLQLDLDKDTVVEDRYSPIIDDCSDSAIREEQQPTKEDDTSAKPELEEEEEESNSQTSSSNDTPSTKESTPAREDEEEDEENQRNRHRVQRSTSLKSGKTPPGTPGRKKIVRFADALGLDLALVRTFLDEVPNVPQSAFSDLSDVSVDDELSMLRTTPQSGSYIRITRRDPATNSSVTTFVNSPRILVASFTQPGNLPDFLDKVKRQKVCLETACMMDESRLRGVIRVLNIDFHKSVLIRFTVDEWRTQSDQLATYVSNSCDGLSDRFSFTLAGAHSMQPGQRLIFALCYRVAGQEIWDSNQGKNYVFQCISNSNYLPSIALSSPSVSDTFLPYM